MKIHEQLWEIMQSYFPDDNLTLGDYENWWEGCGGNGSYTVRRKILTHGKPLSKLLWPECSDEEMKSKYCGINCATELFCMVHQELKIQLGYWERWGDYGFLAIRIRDLKTNGQARYPEYSSHPKWPKELG